MIVREYFDDSYDCSMFEFENGTIVYVGEHNCGIKGFGGSAVRYYYNDEYGYGCKDECEVAMKVYEHFPHLRNNGA